MRWMILALGVITGTACATQAPYLTRHGMLVQDPGQRTSADRVEIVVEVLQAALRARGIAIEPYALAGLRVDVRGENLTCGDGVSACAGLAHTAERRLAFKRQVCADDRHLIHELLHFVSLDTHGDPDNDHRNPALWECDAHQDHCEPTLSAEFMAKRMLAAVCRLGDEPVVARGFDGSDGAR